MQNWIVRRRRVRRPTPSQMVLMVVAAAVLGGLFGALAEYLLDPARGHARRGGGGEVDRPWPLESAEAAIEAAQSEREHAQRRSGRGQEGR